MTDKTKYFLADARKIADRVASLLEPACERVEIAGSIRRAAAMVGDIEIVCQPRLQLDPGALIGGNEISALDIHVERLDKREGSFLHFDQQLRRNGTRYKRLIWHSSDCRIPVDVFAVLPPASWGAILAIRTGPGDFSRGLVTPRRKGGALPDNLQQRDGALWGPGGRVDTPNEGAFFWALGLPYWPPEMRTEQLLVEYLAAQVGEHQE